MDNLTAPRVMSPDSLSAVTGDITTDLYMDGFGLIDSVTFIHGSNNFIYVIREYGDGSGVSLTILQDRPDAEMVRFGYYKGWRSVAGAEEFAHEYDRGEHLHLMWRIDQETGDMPEIKHDASTKD